MLGKCGEVPVSAPLKLDIGCNLRETLARLIFRPGVFNPDTNNILDNMILSLVRKLACSL